MQCVTSRRRVMAEAVADASALVDLLVGNELGEAVQRRIAGHALHALAHVDAEILSALGRLQREGAIEDDEVEIKLHELAVSRGLPLITTDRRLHPVPAADVVVA